MAISPSTTFGQATYWHNHADLPRLAQNVREQVDRQRKATAESAHLRALAALPASS